LTEDETPEPTKELVDRALAGDPTACRVLVGVLAPLIHLRVSALLRHGCAAGRRRARHEVEDLVQIVFIKLFRDQGALQSWRPELGSLRAYIGVIAHNEAYDVLFKKSFTETPTPEEELEQPPAEEDGVDRLMEDRDLARRVLCELPKRLTPKSRVVFTLCYLEGRSVKEIREITGMNEDAVHKALSRIILIVKQLAAELE
jgi:RNA polymerase sigma factor (sigma-70 family)